MNWGYTSCSHKKNNSRNKNKKVKCIKIIYPHLKKNKFNYNKPPTHRYTLPIFSIIIIFVLYFLVIFKIL